MKNIFKSHSIFWWMRIMLLLFFLGGIIVFVWFFQIFFVPATTKNETINIELFEGMGVNAISQKLFENELVKNKFVFETWVWLLRSEGKIIAGAYTIPKNISLRSLTRLLFNGPTKPRDRNITIIEGWTNKQIALYLEKEGLVKKEDFFFTIAHLSSELVKQFPFLQELPDGVDLEGYLFPDTYRVFWKTSGEEIIQKMLENFTKKVNKDILFQIEKQERNLHEVLTLASIIEAEAQKSDDRKMIADIFLKRLKVGIPLQSDATINFITDSGRERSTFEDLLIESPYNTYKYPGLPPGPINNPSLNAILAAILPIANPYYFFLTDKDGSVHYAKNQYEHNINREKYLN